MPTRDTAICLRASDYSETSQILTLFARKSGRFRAIAKGSKRPKSVIGGPVEPFDTGEVVFIPAVAESLSVITEFEARPLGSHAGRNLGAINCGLFAAELIERMTAQWDPHPQLFDSYLQLLQHLADPINNPNRLLLLILFELSLLDELGLRPVLAVCANCSQKPAGKAFFSSEANGLVCSDCEGTFPDRLILSKTASAAIADPRQLASAEAGTLLEVEKILIAHFHCLVQKPLKMAGHVMGM